MIKPDKARADKHDDCKPDAPMFRCGLLPTGGFPFDGYGDPHRVAPGYVPHGVVARYRAPVFLCLQRYVLVNRANTVNIDGIARRMDENGVGNMNGVMSDGFNGFIYRVVVDFDDIGRIVAVVRLNYALLGLTRPEAK